MVGTFLNKDSDDFQKIKVTTTKAEAEMVTNMVGTFLNGAGMFSKLLE